MLLKVKEEIVFVLICATNMDKYPEHYKMTVWAGRAQPFVTLGPPTIAEKSLKPQFRLNKNKLLG